jgi:hypothetical protein
VVALNVGGAMTKLTKQQAHALGRVAWGTKHFGALTTGGDTRRRDVLALLDKGLVADAGMCALCDGDGFTLQPERYRQGWKTTEAGAQWLKDNGRETV